LSELSVIDKIKKDLRKFYIDGLQKLYGLRLLNLYFKGKFSLVFLSALSDTVFTSICKCDISYPFPSPDAISLEHCNYVKRPISRSVKEEIRKQIEFFYEYNTNMMKRCKDGSYHDGQIVALCNWLVQLDPSQHEFLNRIQVFDAIKGVLNFVRDSNSSMESNQTIMRILRIKGCPDFLALIDKPCTLRDGRIDDVESLGGPFLYSMIQRSNQRLTNLALSTMMT